MLKPSQRITTLGRAPQFATTFNHILSLSAPIRQPNRNLWKLRHVYMPEKTPEGQEQRKPTDHPDFMKYTFKFEQEYHRAAPPVKVVLLRDMEDFGKLYDVVDMPARLAREAVLSRAVCYASPFDLEYYGEKKRKLLEKDPRRSMVLPKELIKLGEELAKKVFPILVSSRNSWVINQGILAASLEQAGVIAPLNSIHLAPGDPLERGKKKTAEARLFRFYLTIENKLIVPMVGRIKHVTSSTSKNLFPADEKFDEWTMKNLAQNEMRPETLYFNADGLGHVGGNVGEFMEKRSSRAVTGIE